MAKPPAHFRITFTGELGPANAPLDIWSFGLAFRGPNSTFLTRSDMQPLAVAMAGHWSKISSSINQVARLTRVRVAAIDAEGRYVRDVTGADVAGDATLNAFGGSASAPPPFQIALAVSLVTPAKGPTGHGRFYLPVPDMAMDGATGRITTANRDVHRQRAVTFLDGINTTLAGIGTGGARLVVASGGHARKGIPPGLPVISGVRIGRVPDTQRRRVNALAEEHGAVQALA